MQQRKQQFSYSKTEPEPAPLPPSASRPHLGYIDGFRALLALYVLSVHLIPRVWEQEVPANRLFALAAKLLSGGHFAVTAFIVVSGYCLMLPVIRDQGILSGGAIRFFKRRYVRIAPPMYIVFALSCLLMYLQNWSNWSGYSHSRENSSVTIAQVVGHLTLLQVVVPGGLLPNNDVLWSVSVEFLIYLWFPLLVWLWRRWGALTTTLITITVSYALNPLLERVPYLSALTIQYVAAFALGMLAAGIAYTPAGLLNLARQQVRWYFLAFSLAIIVFISVAVLGWTRVYAQIAQFDLLVALFTACLLVGASEVNQHPVRRLLEARPLVFMGTFSYSLYVIHYPLAELLGSFMGDVWLLGQTTRMVVFLAVFAPMILYVGYLFYHLAERPFHRLSRHIQ